MLLPATMFTLMSDAYADARAMIAGGRAGGPGHRFQSGNLAHPVHAFRDYPGVSADEDDAGRGDRGCDSQCRLRHWAGLHRRRAGARPPGHVRVLDVEHVDALPFYVGMNPVKQVVVRGELVVDAGALVRRM